MYVGISRQKLLYANLYCISVLIFNPGLLDTFANLFCKLCLQGKFLPQLESLERCFPEKEVLLFCSAHKLYGGNRVDGGRTKYRTLTQMTRVHVLYGWLCVARVKGAKHFGQS